MYSARYLLQDIEYTHDSFVSDNECDARSVDATIKIATKTMAKKKKAKKAAKKKAKKARRRA